MMGRPALDLIGQEFNCWKVIERDYEYPRINNLSLKTSYWKCICIKCNKTIKTMRKDTLKKYKGQSCGCESEKLDLTGKTFGRLTVLEEDFDYVRVNNIADKHRRYWKCQCSCNNKTIKSISQNNLMSTTSPTLSCGCLSREITAQRSRKNITGQKFGRLTVLYSTNTKTNNGKYIWHCQCDCGNIVDVPIDVLNAGTKQSCGCLSREKASQRFGINEIGNVYGKLTVIKRDTSQAYNYIHWLCQCSCGNPELESISGISLRLGKRIACSKCRPRSKGEEQIRDILIANNINFIQEKSFDDCRFPDTNRLARFDFYVNDSYIIEFDGIQHSAETSGKCSNWQSLDYIQAHDEIKNNYCLNNNIPIIRIPYHKLNNIQLADLLIETSKYKL